MPFYRFTREGAMFFSTICYAFLEHLQFFLSQKLYSIYDIHKIFSDIQPNYNRPLRQPARSRLETDKHSRLICGLNTSIYMILDRFFNFSSINITILSLRRSPIRIRILDAITRTGVLESIDVKDSPFDEATSAIYAQEPSLASS